MGNGVHGYTNTGEPLIAIIARHVLLREVNKEVNDWMRETGATSAILGCGAQVECQPNQELFIGCGVCACNHQEHSAQQPGDAACFKLLHQQSLKLLNTYMDWTAAHPPLLGADCWQTQLER